MKTGKKFLSIALTILIVFSTFSISFVFWSNAESEGKKITEYSKGDIIEFGWYPQSKVDDEAITVKLNNLAGDNTTWISYNYYSGTGNYDDGQMVPSDYMRYKDVIYNGNKYRGVYFDDYRPSCTGYTSTKNYQNSNDYTTNTVYWFKYEPIQWRVLDPSTGLVICESIIDSQACNNYCYYVGQDSYGYNAYWGNSDKTYYANNYEKSDIRAWLNDNFYNIAFSKQQQDIIEVTEIDNKAWDISYSDYDSATTNDKIFLLSYDDAINSNYFDSSADRQVKGTDYAKCQGLWVDSSNGISNEDYSYWRLRSAGSNSGSTCGVEYDGDIYDDFCTFTTDDGIRPALTISLDKEIIKPKKISNYNKGDIVEFGYYPQSKVDDEAITTELNNLAGDNKEWISYNYYSGTCSLYDGQMAPSNFMRYKDVIYKGNKYRGVYFDDYRPYCTGYNSSKNYQYANGYTTNTVYWFKYEPIQWRVLDPSTGLVISEMVLDSQAYNNYILSSGDDIYVHSAYWGDAEKSYFSNNYEKSSIRKWLNNNFYNIAFSNAQKENIEVTELSNKAYTPLYSAYNSATTNDKIFLLSYDDVNNSNYFDSSESRKASGSDYAKCQGLFENAGYSTWRLRTAGGYSWDTCRVLNDGGVNVSSNTYGTINGIRPAMTLNADQEIKQSNVEELHTHSYDNVTVIAPTCKDGGYTLYTCSCGDNNTTKIPALGHTDTNKDGICDTCKVVINEELNNKYLVSKATINVPSGKTVDYRNKVKLTATAANVPNGYYVQIFEGTKAVGEKGATSATYTSGELKAGVTYTVKIVDAKGNVVSSDAQNKTVKVDVNAGFFKKLIAFFKGLFGTLPTINL